MSGSFTRILLITIIGTLISLSSISQTNPKWQGAWRASDTAFVGKNGNTWKLSARKGFDAVTFKATKYFMSTKIPGYWEYLPNGYETNTSKSYPLIIYFPGCGETNGGTAYLKPNGELLYRYGLGRLFFDENKFFYPGDPSVSWYNPYDSMSFPSLPTLLRDNGDYFSNVPKKTLGQVYPWGGPTEQVIVLCLAYNANPNIPCSGVQEVYTEDIDAALQQAFQLYRIDPTRVYMTGMSQGAKSSWFYPGSSVANAKKIAATAPVGSVHSSSDIINGGAANIAAGGTRLLSIVNRYDLNTNGTGTNAFLINLQSEQAVNSIAPKRVILDTFFYQWQVSPPFSPSNPSTLHNGWARAYRTDTYEVPFIDSTASTPQRYTVFEWFLTNKSSAAPAVCSAPSSATTTNITQTAATLGWSAGTGNTNFTIEYRNSLDSAWTVLATDTNTVKYTLTGLTASKLYYWRVKGKCDGGAVTTYLNATFGTLSACSVPGSLVSSNITPTSAQLSWTAATGALSYDVQYKKASDASWIVAVSGATGTAYNLSDLSEGTSYQWSVRTNCANGSSAYVESQFATSGTVACTAPPGLNAGSITASSAQLSWTAASGALSYDVEYKTAASANWTLAVAGATGTAYNLSGLAEATSYNWRVKTNCASGSSTFANGSFTTISATPVGNCPTPTGLTTSSITQSAAQFSWTWVGATNYTFEYKVAGTDTWIVASNTIQGSSYGLYTLNSGTTYDWRLKSNCGANGSSVYVSSQFTTLPCNPPASLTSSNINNTSAQLSWVAAPGAANYALEYKAVSALSWTVAASAVWGTSYTLSGLQTGTTYEWRLKSNCGNSGNSAYASGQFTTTGGAPTCNPPSGLSSGSITVSSAVVSWAASGNAASYDVEYKGAADANWTTAATAITATSFTLTALQEATAYDWRVKASCGSIGNSGYTASQFTTRSSIVVCDAPSGLSSGSITVSSAQLSWTSVSTGLSYDVEYKASSSAIWLPAITGTASTSYSLSSLAAGTSYDWRVRTNCGASGSSGYSVAQFTTTSNNPPVGNCTAPSSLKSSNITNSSAQFSWAWVGASSYTFEYKPSGSATWIVASTTIQGSSYALYNLSAGTTYDWRVRSNCGANGSSVYVADQFTTLACPAPTGLSVGSTTSTSAQVSWAWVGGSSYRVEYKASSAQTWTVVSEFNAGTSAFITGLAAGTSYNWRVSTNCGNSGSSLYTASQFTTSVGTVNPGITLQQGMTMETSGWKVYPVPAKTHVNFSFKSTTGGKAQIAITDLSGRTVKTETIMVTGGMNNARIDLAGIRPGMYLLRMTGKENSQVSKIIIQ